MIHPRLTRYASRRGSSLLEMGIAITVMLTITLAIWLIATGLWTRAVMESTASVASLNAQAAYNRLRFAPGVLANPNVETDAQNAAITTANFVINNALTIKQANLMGLTSSGGVTCIAPMNEQFGTTKPLFAGNLLRRRIQFDNGVRSVNDRVITVSVGADWKPLTIPTSVLPASSSTACIKGQASALGRKAS